VRLRYARFELPRYNFVRFGPKRTADKFGKSQMKTIIISTKTYPTVIKITFLDSAEKIASIGAVGNWIS
jgi:hypothetical protein